MTSAKKIQALEDSCNKVLQLPKIRFVGVLDNMGNKIAGGFKKEIVSYLPDKDNRQMYVQLVLEYLMRKDFDDALGSIDYITSRRGKITMISVPTREYLVLITAERDANIEEIIHKVNTSFTMLPDIVP